MSFSTAPSVHELCVSLSIGQFLLLPRLSSMSFFPSLCEKKIYEYTFMLLFPNMTTTEDFSAWKAFLRLRYRISFEIQTRLWAGTKLTFCSFFKKFFKTTRRRTEWRSSDHCPDVESLKLQTDDQTFIGSSGPDAAETRGWDCFSEMPCWWGKWSQTSIFLSDWNHLNKTESESLRNFSKIFQTLNAVSSTESLTEQHGIYLKKWAARCYHRNVWSY